MPDSIPQSPQRVVTFRAVLAGAICAAFISFGDPYGAFKVKAATMTLDFSVPAAVFMMFMLCLVVNLVRVAWGVTLLNRGEMLVAYSMMAVACGICTMGLTGYLVPMLGTPVYYQSPENKWAALLLPHMPQWLMLSPAGEGQNAINYMYVGMPANVSAVQKWAMFVAWLKPLGYWTIFLLALYGGSICLMAMFRKQWVEDERIAFPLVQLPMELAAAPADAASRVTPILKNRLLWLGFAVPFIFCALKALPAYLPELQALKPKEVWIAKMLDEQWQLQFRLSWQTIGLAYLLSADVGLCVWLFGLLGSFYHGLSRFAGFQSIEKLGTYGAGPFPDLGHFGMGAMIVLVLIRLWTGRRHLAAVFRKAVLRDPAVDDKSEPMSYAHAFWGALVCFVVMTAWLCASGFSLPIALLVLFGAFVGFIGLSRIIAESGMPVSIVPLISSDFVVSAVGTSAIGREGLLAMSWTYVWNGDVRTFVMCSAAHGMRACSERSRSYRGLFLAMMIAVVIALVVSIAATLSFAYDEGGVTMAGWFFSSGPKYPFDFVRGLIEKPRTADARGWIATGVGAGAMLLMSMARRQFAWWPINPVGLPIAVVSWTQYLWFSVFLAWVLKSRFLKYGGPKLYLKLRPLFLGLVLGQYTGAAFWTIVDVITGMRENSTFWI